MAKTILCIEGALVGIPIAVACAFKMCDCLRSKRLRQEQQDRGRELAAGSALEPHAFPTAVNSQVTD